jgi:hypothetical protein
MPHQYQDPEELTDHVAAAATFPSESLTTTPTPHILLIGPAASTLTL